MNKQLYFTTCALATALLFFPNVSLAKNTPEELFAKGLREANANNYRKAEKYFTATTKKDSGHYPSYYNLSLITTKQQNYKTSLKHLKLAGEYNPFDLRINKMLTTAHSYLGNYDEAILNAEKIIKKVPTDINAQKMIGIIHLENEAYDRAIAKFTLTKNLNPKDIHNAFLLATAYILKGDHLIALKRITPFKDQLDSDQLSSLYAFILFENNDSQEALRIDPNIENTTPEDLFNNFLNYAKEKIAHDELDKMTYITDFLNPEVTQRIVKRKEREIALRGSSSPSASNIASKKRPLQWKGTLVESFEHYDRDPRSSSPINGLNVTSNLQIKGKTKNNINLSAEVEGFFNRWDNNKVDYYKANVLKRNNFEIDVGKFSSKHFPSLVSYPTVLDGVRVWKKLGRTKFTPKTIDDLSKRDGPINLGDLYRESTTDKRFFEDIEITAVAGRTAVRKNVDDRSEENEETYETSGQFEQWTQSYRLYANFGKYFDLGASASYTTDVNERAVVSSSTDPIESMALGLDGGVDLLDNKLNFDFEVAFSDYNLDLEDYVTKHERDAAYTLSAQYKIIDTLTFSYDYKNIGRNFEVEGASQTQDKITNEYDLVYKAKTSTPWSIKSQSLTLKPEITGANGGGSSKKRFRTFESVTTVQLPQEATYTFDYEYYKEVDKCGCSHYIKTTFEQSAQWEFKPLKTIFKPSYTFERKNDLSSSATDEKMSEYSITLECNFIKNLELDYSWEREIKKFRGFTEKSYHQHINSLEAKYTFIPSRMDARAKYSRDFKDPSDTNKVDIDTYSLEYNYTTKDGDDKFNVSWERKLNVYKPWAESSAYKQNYWELKYTKKF